MNHFKQRIYFTGNPITRPAEPTTTQLMLINDSINLYSFFNILDGRLVKKAHVSLEICGSGQSTVEIIEIFNGVETTVASVVLNNPISKTTTIDFETNDRFYYPVIRTNSQFTVDTLNWLIKPSQMIDPIRIAGVFCTFKKEAELTKNIEIIRSSLNDNFELVIVDNNGPTDSILKKIVDTGDSEHIHYFSQSNYGGAGGFTRGLVEALNLDKFSHVLFMDDDVEIFDDLINRLVWMVTLNQKICISGAMLDMLDRNLIFEASAEFDFQNLLLHAKWHNKNVFSTELTFEAELSGANFGAWWFFCFPVEAVRKVGLPFPYFIKGDDIEYGYRLSRAGYNITNAMGIGLWHEPFYIKSMSWPHYYSTRNYLFSQSFHQFNNTFKTLKRLIVIFQSYVLKFDYQTAYAVLLGLKSYNSASIFEDLKPDETHKRLNQSLSRYPKSEQDAEMNLSIAPKSEKLKFGYYLYALLHNLFPVFINKPQILPAQQFKFSFIRSSQVLVYNGFSKKMTGYTRRPLTYLKLSLQFFLEIIKFWALNWLRTKEYFQLQKNLKSIEHWQKIFSQQVEKVAPKVSNTSLLENIFVLYFLQGFNYLYPLIIIPFLARVFEPTGFGHFNLIQTLAGYALLVIDFGFNISATNQISVHRNDPTRLREISSNTQAAKWLLVAGTLLFGCVGYFIFPQIRLIQAELLVAFLGVIGQSLFPQWYFVGREDSKSLVWLNLAPRLLSFPFYFMFVHSSADIIRAFAIQSTVFLVSGALGVIYMRRQLKISHLAFHLKGAVDALKEGWLFFMSNIAIHLYTSVNILCLAWLSSPYHVGLYSAASKIVSGLQSLYYPLATALFPRMSYLAINDRASFFSNYKLLMKRITFASALLSFFVFVFAHPIIVFLFGEKYQEAIALLRILAFVPMIVGLSNIIGLQGLVSLGLKREYNIALVGGALVNLIIITPLAYFYESRGAAFSLLACELFVLVFFNRYLKRHLHEKQ